MKNIETTYGKIILIGEHSVVYGKPAIAIPFKGTKLSVYIEKSNENQIFCKFYDGKLEESSDDLLGLRKLIEQFLIKNSIEEKILINIDSNIPNERGMGSSAAAAVAVSRALFKYFDIEFKSSDIIKWANISEKIVHGNPSGIDINVVASNQSLYFVKDQPFVNFPIDIDAYLIIADTGKKGKTKEAVEDVKKLIDSNPVYMKYIDRLGELTDESRFCIENGNVKKLGNIMNEVQEMLRKLTVSDDNLEKLIEIANDAGALGSKLTGGGRGGCMIAISDNLNTAENIMGRLEKKAENVWITKLKK